MRAAALARGAADWLIDGTCAGGDPSLHHGLAGTVLLARVTADQAWTALGDRCWRTIRESGLPRRIRPGFWDNNGRCCGTAGVLAPRAGWAMGNAGIIRELLRYARLSQGVAAGYAVPWPDHPVTRNA